MVSLAFLNLSVVSIYLFIVKWIILDEFIIGTIPKSNFFLSLSEIQESCLKSLIDKLSSNLMYQNNFVKGDPLLHSVDFNSLKKNNLSPLFLLEDGYLSISKNSNPVLLILGAFALMYSPI